MRNRPGPLARRTGMGRAALLLAAGLILAGCGTAEPDAGALVSAPADADGYAGAAVDPAYTRPSLQFTDTAGQGYDLATDMTHPVSLVFFGYTSCPDVCSTVLADAAAAIRRLDPAVAEQTGLVFITVDPERDTPTVIRDYLDQFSPEFTGLTADVETIAQAADALAVAYEPPNPQPGGYEVQHGTQLLGFGPPGSPGIIWTAGTSVGDLRADITRLAEDA
jgi:protein SCO1